MLSFSPRRTEQTSAFSSTCVLVFIEHTISYHCQATTMFYCQLVLIAIVVAGSRGAEHSHFTGPFGHVHLQSSNPSPFNCNRSAVAFSRSINEWSLNVSSTRYSSGDQINVTWSPLASVCPDDFIGIYFPSTPSSSGKRDSIVALLSMFAELG